MVHDDDYDVCIEREACNTMYTREQTLNNFGVALFQLIGDAHILIQ